MNELHAKKLIEDIARRVAKEELATDDRAVSILRRRVESMEESYAAIGGTVGDVQNQVNVIEHSPPEALNQNIGFMVDSDGDGVADHWTFGGTATAKTASLDSSKYVYGAKSQKLSILATNTLAGGTAYVKQTIPAEPNRVYCFSLYYCGDTVDALSYDCYIRKNHADATYTDVPLSLPLTANWERRWIATTAEANVTSIDIYVGIKANQAGIAVNAWFDLVIVNGGPFPMPVPGLIDGIIDEDHVDHVPPPNPTLDSVNTTAGVELLGEWTLNYYVQVQWTPITNPGDFKCYNVYVKETAATNWILAQVVRNINTNKAKIGGLKENTSYTVAVTSEDIFGNEGAISATLARMTPADLPPGNVGTVNSNFAGVDCQLWWNEVTTNSDSSPAIDIRGYVVEVYRDTVKKRTEFVSSPYYNYTFEKNQADGLVPNPIFKIYAKDIKGQLSTTPATVQPVNLPPAAGAAPSAVAAFKVVVISCPLSSESDVRGLRVYHSLDNVTYTLLGDAQGTFYVHKTDCTVPHYYKYKYLDAFGQESPYSPVAGPTATTDGLIQPSDLAGALYQIVPSSNPAPATGTLQNLYDGDSATVATFNAAGYVQFDFPVEHVFNKVIVELEAPVQYYVNYYDGAAWVDICGTATVPKQGVAGQNTEKFTKQIQTRKLRFNFLAGCTIKELKFSAYVVADEIDAGLINLAKGIQIYNNATGSGWRLTSEGALFENGYVTMIGAGGTLRIDSTGLVGMNFELTADGFRLYSTDNKFQITPAGMFATDPADPTKMVKMDSRGLYLSKDGGTTWSTVITADGIEGGRIKANTIQANALSMNVTLTGDVDPAVDTVFPFDGTLLGTRGTRATFSRSSVAYLSDGTQVASAQPRFETGKFSKAVMAEDGTTNLYTADESSYENGIATATTSGAGPILSSDMTRARHGAKSLKITWPVGASSSVFVLTAAYRNLTGGLPYSFQARVWAPAADEPFVMIRVGGQGGQTEYALNTLPVDSQGWRVFTFTFTPASSGVYTILLRNMDSTVERVAWVDCIGCEQKSYATSWTLGGSTRSPETLTIPSSVLNPQEGTVEEYFLFPDFTKFAGTSNWRRIWGIGNNDITGHYSLSWQPTDSKLHFRIRGASLNDIAVTPPSPGWHHVACRWSAQEMALLIDGTKVGYVTAPVLATSFADTVLAIGGRTDGLDMTNTLTDSLRLSTRAYTDSEVAAHAAATSPPTEGGQSMNADLWPIRAVGQQIWLDSTGLYMKNATAPNIMMHLNAERLAFWDTLGMPSIGIGDVADMAAQLDSDMQYGLLIAQGEIRATQAVIRNSLTDFSIGQTKVEDGTMTLNKLSELISVTIPDRLQRRVYQTNPYPANRLTNPGFETGTLSGWTGTGTVTTYYDRTGSYGVGDPSCYQEFAASPGETWEASAWCGTYSGTGDKRAYVYLRFLNSARTQLAEVVASYLNPPNWTQLVARGVAPANTAYVRIALAYSGAGDKTVIFDDAMLKGPGLSTSYTTFLTATIPAAECCEQIKLISTISNPLGKTVTVKGTVNGTTIFETSSTLTTPIIAVTQDVRSFAGDLNIVVQAKTSDAYAEWVSCELLQNQRLPLRAAAPKYAVTNATESSCSSACEASCMTSCMTGCMSSCQSSCQDPCQSSCQSTCELTAQGGGCFIEGTPVSIYHPETGEIIEIPIETLGPGAQMPAYDPLTDSVAITQCVGNTRSKTGTLFVIEVEGGHVLRVTGEQPFDVLRPNMLTGEVAWQKVQARYLNPGDIMVRPFDAANKMPRILAVTETIVPATWVWNPRTASGRYIAAGFGDAYVKV